MKPGHPMLSFSNKPKPPPVNGSRNAPVSRNKSPFSMPCRKRGATINRSYSQNWKKPGHPMLSFSNNPKPPPLNSSSNAPVLNNNPPISMPCRKRGATINRSYSQNWKKPGHPMLSFSNRPEPPPVNGSRSAPVSRNKS